MAEKLSVRWDDFKDHTLDVIGSLKEETDFADVTLACEDGQQIHTHKLILVKSSPFFRDLLKMKNHPHPLVFMRGVKSEEMLAIMDFVYFGEAKVLQKNIDSFLALTTTERSLNRTRRDLQTRPRDQNFTKIQRISGQEGKAPKNQTK